MKKLIIANWKMNPENLGQAQEIVVRVDENVRAMTDMNFDLVICPPFVFIEEVSRLLQGMTAQLGAQDIALSSSPAQTGEISGAQLAGLGARYVIIGHSDRRWKLGESEDVTNAKLKATLAENLVPIVCLGERTRQGQWQDELGAQTLATLQGMTPGQVSSCIIAYEPVWAISTNPDAKPDTPASAVQSMTLIRQVIGDHFGVSHPTFVYGGSVNPANARDFLSRPEIRGVLVGAASLNPEDFTQILRATVE